MGQERLGPSYFFIPLVLGPLNSLVWYVPSLRYTRGLGWRMHCGAKVTESSTNKQHHLSLGRPRERGEEAGGRGSSRAPAPCACENVSSLGHGPPVTNGSEPNISPSFLKVYGNRLVFLLLQEQVKDVNHGPILHLEKYTGKPTLSLSPDEVLTLVPLPGHSC